MTRNKIFAKLRRKNKGQYGILAFCIFLSVLLLTAFALMYFGPTVQEFLPEGGDTRKLAILLLGATAVGCAIFTLYASILFFRYKSREYGIFLALGEQKKTLGTRHILVSIATNEARELLDFSVDSYGWGGKKMNNKILWIEII